MPRHCDTGHLKILPTSLCVSSYLDPNLLRQSWLRRSFSARWSLAQHCRWKRELDNIWLDSGNSQYPTQQQLKGADNKATHKEKHNYYAKVMCAATEQRWASNAIGFMVNTGWHTGAHIYRALVGRSQRICSCRVFLVADATYSAQFTRFGLGGRESSADTAARRNREIEETEFRRN